MSKKSDADSITVATRLLLLCFTFYVIFYIFSVILIGGFKIEWAELGRLPFQHEHFGFGNGDLALAAWIALVLALAIKIVLIFFIGKSTRLAWDYAVSISILHFCITCIVTQKFPNNWAWWVTLIVGTIITFASSELACYFLRDLREIALDH